MSRSQWAGNTRRLRAALFAAAIGGAAVLVAGCQGLEKGEAKESSDVFPDVSCRNECAPQSPVECLQAPFRARRCVLLADGCTHWQEEPCDDGSPCTSDFCAAPDGCVHGFEAGPCDDGEPCTSGDACSEGKCDGAAYSCDDALTCTLDVCDGAGGCKHEIAQDACLIEGLCYAAGAAAPGDQNLRCTPAAKKTGFVRFVFDEAPNTSGAHYTYGLGVADFDGDGDLDALETIQEDLVVRYDNQTADDPAGTGILMESQVIQTKTGGWYSTPALDDVDRDGDIDAIVTWYTLGDPLLLRWNPGDGVFEPDPAALQGKPSCGGELADLDRDGILEYIALNAGFVVYENDGTGTFACAEPCWYAGPSGGLDGCAVGIGDVNRDGWLDAGSGNVLLLSDGAGGFTSETIPGEDVRLSRLADLDGDGDLDSFGGGVVLIGDGQRAFAPNGEAVVTPDQEKQYGEDQYAAADMDNDGDLDLVGFYRVFLNDGKARFSDSGVVLDYPLSTKWTKPKPGEKPRFPDSVRTRSPVVVDMDGDGRLDIVVGLWTFTNRVWLNRSVGIASNQRPAAPPSTSAELGDGVVKLLWEPGSDAETPVSSLTYDLRVGSSPGGGDLVSVVPDASDTPGRGPGSVGAALSQVLRLPAKVPPSLCWSVRTVDTGWRRSEWISGTILTR